MAEKLYTASVTSTGGGRDGHVEGDGNIDFDVRPPKEMGGDGAGVNPEALIAAAWSACFNGALQLIMKNHDVDVSAHQPEVTADFSINKDPSGEGFRLSGVIKAKFKNQEQIDNAASLVQEAHEFCPVSKALRGEADIEAGLG
ncbi:Ohr family peroxiredoxin [Corynebacterium halotolerans]|uniref:Ohr family peroxiredoxin n=1 Tax=Corynebacterium halotolerans TaxID=225326 RepID=UPI003CF7ADA8